jgi:hypothetical protein
MNPVSIKHPDDSTILSGDVSGFSSHSAGSGSKIISIRYLDSNQDWDPEIFTQD